MILSKQFSFDLYSFVIYDCQIIFNISLHLYFTVFFLGGTCRKRTKIKILHLFCVLEVIICIIVGDHLPSRSLIFSLLLLLTVNVCR